MGVLRAMAARGPVVALGAIGLTAAILLISTRFEEKWGAGIHLLLFGVPAALAVAVVLGAFPRRRLPPAWLSAFVGCAAVLLLGTAFSLADVLGAETDDLSSSTGTFVSGLVALAMAVLAWRRDSGLATLLAAVAAVAAALFATDWIADPGGDTFRAVLIGCFAALMLGALALRRVPRHATALANAAGLSAVAVAALTLGAGFFFGFGFVEGEATGRGWELALVAMGLLLCAYGVLVHAPGPGWLGAATLVVFTTIAADTEDATLAGWPLLLLVVSLAALVYGILTGRRTTNT